MILAACFTLTGHDTLIAGFSVVFEFMVSIYASKEVKSNALASEAKFPSDARAFDLTSFEA